MTSILHLGPLRRAKPWNDLGGRGAASFLVLSTTKTNPDTDMLTCPKFSTTSAALIKAGHAGEATTNLVGLCHTGSPSCFVWETIWVVDAAIAPSGIGDQIVSFPGRCGTFPKPNKKAMENVWIVGQLARPAPFVQISLEKQCCGKKQKLTLMFQRYLSSQRCRWTNFGNEFLPGERNSGNKFGERVPGYLGFENEFRWRSSGFGTNSRCRERISSFGNEFQVSVMNFRL